MRSTHFVLSALLVFGSPEYAGPKKPVRATIPCTVAKVTDGDSIVCAHLGRVRLLGIDAPELSQKPFGKQSQGALAAMIPLGSTVQLEQDVQAQDRNGDGGRPAIQGGGEVPAGAAGAGAGGR